MHSALSVGVRLLLNIGMAHRWHRLLEIFVFKAVSKRRRGVDRQHGGNGTEMGTQFGYPRARACWPTMQTWRQSVAKRWTSSRLAQQSSITLVSCSVSDTQNLSEQKMDQQKERSSSEHSPSLEACRCHHPHPHEHTANPSTPWIQAWQKAHMSSAHINANPSGSE